MRLMILRVGYCFLLFSLVFSCSVPEHPPVFKGVEKIKISKFSTKGVKLNALVKFYNPNDTGVKLKSVSIDVIVDGKKVAHADQVSKMKIKPMSNFHVPLNINIDLREMGLVSGIFGILTGKSLDATFTGHLKLSKGGIAFKVPVNFKQRIRLK